MRLLCIPSPAVTGQAQEDSGTRATTGDVAAVRRPGERPSTAVRARAVVCAPVSIGARGQPWRTRARSAGGRVGPDGVDEDAMVADGAGVGAGEVKGEEGGEPAEGQGWVIVADGAQGEGVVGTAVGAGGARAGVTHGGRLWRRPRRPPVRRAAARGRHGS